MTDSLMTLILIPDADGAVLSFKREHGVRVYCLIKSNAWDFPTGLCAVGISKLF